MERNSGSKKKGDLGILGYLAAGALGLFAGFAIKKFVDDKKEEKEESQETFNFSHNQGEPLPQSDNYQRNQIQQYPSYQNSTSMTSFQSSSPDECDDIICPITLGKTITLGNLRF